MQEQGLADHMHIFRICKLLSVWGILTPAGFLLTEMAETSQESSSYLLV